MIENDPDLSLPCSYETKLGGSAIERLQCCIETCEARLTSERQYGVEGDVRKANKKLEYAAWVLEQARRYESDLRQEIDIAQSEKDSLLKFSSPASDHTSEPKITRSSLVKWAYQTQKVDIGGFFARRRGKVDRTGPRFTDEISTKELKKWGKEHLADPRKIFEGFEERENREQMFAAALLLLRTYLDLTLRTPDWKTEVDRQGAWEVDRFIELGIVNLNSIAKAVSLEAEGSERTHENFLRSLCAALIDSSVPDQIFSKRQVPSANNVIYGLAFAVLDKSKGGIPPDERENLRNNHQHALLRLRPLLIGSDKRGPANNDGADPDLLEKITPTIRNAWDPDKRKPKKSKK